MEDIGKIIFFGRKSAIEGVVLLRNFFIFCKGRTLYIVSDDKEIFRGYGTQNEDIMANT